MRDQLRMFLQTAVYAADAMATRAAAPYRVMMETRISAPERLRAAPQDIRTVDATVAEEIYAGYFSFDGKAVNARGRSPFLLEPPSEAWRRSLTGFSWLRHLRRASAARTLVEEFLEQRGFSSDDPALEPAVTARRMLSFLAHSPLLLRGADPSFHEAFLAALESNAKALTRTLVWNRARGADRLLCALALLEFCMCGDIDAEVQSQATRLCVEELERQILGDGGHIGRNPQTALDVLLDLLPLRQVYAARGVHPPRALSNAIDRMIPLLRLLQHGDGALALFNGMGATDPGELATVFMHEAPGDPPLDAPKSGYMRLAARDAVAIVDAGAPPAFEFSRFAHAGSLAFEFSLGAERVVVNCGAPGQGSASRETARATAAHSTLAINDQSSSQIAPPSAKSRFGLILVGARTLSAARRQARSGELLQLAHEGYAVRFGLIHRRLLGLAQDGSRLVGEDRLTATDDTQGRAPRHYALRFHLHPSVRARAREGRREIELTLPSGRLLLFSASKGAPRLEESVFFATPEGSRKTTQIVLKGEVSPGMRLRWMFRRDEAAADN